MPNFEIYGNPEYLPNAATFELDLNNALKGSAYANDVVTTRTLSSVEDLNGKKQAFIRIVATERFLDAHLHDMLKRLAFLGLDIEVQELREYVPAAANSPRS